MKSWNLKTYVLVVFAAFALHVSVEATVFAVAACALSDAIDRYRLKKALAKFADQVSEDEEGWETDADDPDREAKGEFTRYRLPIEQQHIIRRFNGIMFVSLRCFTELL